MEVAAIRPLAIGWKAHAALRATGGAARILAPLGASTYLDAGGEVIWLGRREGVRHPRAVLAAAIPAAGSGSLRLDLGGLDPWPARERPAADAVAARGAALVLRDRLRSSPALVPAPQGLGRLLVGVIPDFPLGRAGAAVREMARACERGDARAALNAAESLLGLGPGLTPSGDDLVGGVLFARRAVLPDAGWARAGVSIVARARTRTHPISATLLADLAMGQGYEPLHDLVDALGQGDISAASDALERLSRLGHSSGWDMATGVLIALAGRAVLPLR